MSDVARLTIAATTLPSPGVTAAAILGASGAVLALTLLMRRRPESLPLLAILALPFRLPIVADGRTVNLLIPLYLVVAAGTVSHLLPRLWDWWGRRAGRGQPPDGSDDDDVHGERGVAGGEEPVGVSLRRPSTWASPRGLEWVLLASVVVYAVQGIYSADHTKALENVAFFYLPFGLLFLLLRDVRWTRELVIQCLTLAVVLAVLFAGVGFVEYYRKSLFLNPKVVSANQYDNYFRVNSVFFDPSIYGRFLAVVMIMVTTVVLWSRRRWDVLAGATVLAWLLAGLVMSFSESSVAALLVGLAVLAAWRWDLRGTLYVTVALLAIAGVVLAAAPASLHFGLKGAGSSANNATSGRTNLISGGLDLFAERPLQGWGSGSFQTEYARHSKTPSVANATSASHTIPVTVAAEQGIVGLVSYVALVIVAFLVLFRGAGRSPPRIAIAACFAALVLHTWTYADFLEDPLTWTLLGIGVAFVRGSRTGAVSSV
jgi:O-antigen ligase